ncbi:MAG TPA: RIP metalloprotease RseP [Woeseiaceae bacterium]|nr:RIP metalloprotease RseP [Woeseiaceae bacterium]
MNAALLNLLAFVVAISVLVAVHELGHFLVGRWSGMKVLRYSIGFGKPLWTRVFGRDRTEFCISAVPLGGYVKFLDEREGPIEAADRGRAFNHRPVPARIAVLLAGPLFNFLFAVVAYWVLFLGGVSSVTPAVGQVEPGSYAAEAGLRQGDRILRIGEEAPLDWQEALIAMFEEMIGDGRIPFEVEGEDGRIRHVVVDVGEDAVRLTEPGESLFFSLGFRPWQPPAVVGTVEEDSAAEAADLRSGDRITAIDGEPVRDFGDLRRIVAERPGRTVTIRLERDGGPRNFDATLGVREQDGARLGYLGIGPAPTPRYVHERQYGPLGALGASLGRTWDSTGFTIRMLARMVTGDVSVRNLSGPLSIAQYAGGSAAAGPGAFIDFLAVVSLSLGVLNLLPIPVLDGGQVVYQLIELVKGSPLSDRSQLVGQQVGIIALLILMSFAFYNDIARIFG